MEGRDTILEIPQGTEPGTTMCRHCAYRFAQAEYSYEKGQDSILVLLPKYFEAIREIGCKTVAEWVSKHVKMNSYIYISLVEWGYQLKEWGID